LHVADLVDLLDEQLAAPDDWAGTTFNVGGGRTGSLSLAELTEACRDITGHAFPIESAAESPRQGDVPVYLSDCGRLFRHSVWRPRRDPHAILGDIFAWVQAYEDAVRSALSFD
jgi:CDP-paratose 2-epimerase